MDNDQQLQVIEARLDAIEDMPVSDDRSARQALTHVLVTVSRISQLSAQARAQAMVGGGASTDDTFERLGTWLDRLVDVLTRIIAEVPEATSFSMSVGANVSVTVDFRPPTPAT